MGGCSPGRWGKPQAEARASASFCSSFCHNVPVFARSPALYRPFLGGRYFVSAGLYRLGTQPVPWVGEASDGGQVEGHTFALDRDYPRFVASKVAAHRRALHEYVGEAGLTPELREAALACIARTLAAESDGVMT